MLLSASNTELSTQRASLCSGNVNCQVIARQLSKRKFKGGELLKIVVKRQSLIGTSKIELSDEEAYPDQGDANWHEVREQLNKRV
jgi:hypothetical protein